jgi:exonuclease III
MRIDHLLVSEELMVRVADAQILGRGPEAKGFLGSDHCPMLLTLLPSP